MADKVAGGYNGVLFNNFFFETLLMIIIIYWLLRWLFGFGYCNY